MARFNEILVGRFSRTLEKLFSMKGGPPAPQLSSEIQVTLGIPLGRESDPHLGWTRFATGGNLTGAAGFPAQFRFRNPAASNVIAVFESILLSAAANDEFLISQGAGTTDFAAVSSGANMRLDNRGAVNAPTIVISSATGVARSDVGVVKVDAVVLARSPLQIIQGSIGEIPLLPGDAMNVVDAVNAQQIFVTVFWRERFLEESERTG